MTREEIRNEIKNKVKEMGVKKAYQYFVIAKVIRPQLNGRMVTDSDKFHFISLSHSITCKGFKDVNMLDIFKELFYIDNIIEDYVYDEILEELLIIASK